MSRPSVEQRSHQVFLWCEARWVTPYPCYLKWLDEIRDDDEPDAGVYGDCSWDSNRRALVLRLSRATCRRRDDAIHTVIHEYAHAITTPNWRVYLKAHHMEDHSDEYWLAYGRIYRAFYDEGGWKEAFRIRTGSR